MRRGLVGREGHGLAQQLDGFVVLMLVDELRRARAQRIGRLLAVATAAAAHVHSSSIATHAGSGRPDRIGI